jgi:hypothetical protein
MGTVMLVGPVGVVSFVSLFAPTLPIRCSSDPKGTPMKPAVFYAVEDVAAVDFKEGRAYRQALNDRYVVVVFSCSRVYCLLTSSIAGTYHPRSGI